jgi:hypothetical protein
MNKQFYRKHILPIQVPIEWELNKIRRKIDNFYKLIGWKILSILFLVLWLSILKAGTYWDRDWSRAFANIDLPNSPFYTNWRTDGSPGQDPPSN